MKATGIVRRIDDLGRVVIPKEIRRTMRIRESDPLEIFTSHEGEIILKKYSPIGEMSTFAKQYVASLAQVSGHVAVPSPGPERVQAVLRSAYHLLPPCCIRYIMFSRKFLLLYCLMIDHACQISCPKTIVNVYNAHAARTGVEHGKKSR